MLDVGLAVAQIVNYLVEVLEEQVLVAQKLLLAALLFKLLWIDIFSLLQDSHRVVVRLPVKQNVETALFKVSHRKRKCTL